VVSKTIDGSSNLSTRAIYVHGRMVIGNGLQNREQVFFGIKSLCGFESYCTCRSSWLSGLKQSSNERGCPRSGDHRFESCTAIFGEISRKNLGSGSGLENRGLLEIGCVGSNPSLSANFEWYTLRTPIGRVAEWSIAPVLKTGGRNRSVGSNPTSSSISAKYAEIK